MANYKNPELTIHERITDLMARMTLEEKVGQVNQHLYGWKTYAKLDNTFELTDYLKDHVALGGGLGALYGLFRADPWSQVNEKNGVPAEDSWRLANKIQHYVITHSRLSIPVLFAEECPHGHQGLGSVSYPTNIGKGNSFNRALIEETSRNMAEELAMKGVHLALVSSLDLSRDPRWGRTEECYGEDPYLAAAFNHSIVKGFQQDLITDAQDFVHQTVGEINRQPSQIGVVLKHCIAQGDAIGGHNSGAVSIGERDFMELYYPLLKSTKNAVGVMAAYNDLDGVPCHSNHYLLETLLRKEIGYQGIVMADGTALDRLNSIYGSDELSAKNALFAGVDLSLWDQTYLSIVSGVEQNIIPMELLDKAVYRVLSIKFLLGLFENPYVEAPSQATLEKIKTYPLDNKKMALESITLLKNNGILPLKDEAKKIAVIGPNADAIYNQLGDYTAPQTEKMQQQTIFRELIKAFPTSSVEYALGCEIRNLANQESHIQAAVELAAKSDLIILVLGGSSARNFNMEFLSNGAVSSKGVNMDSGENVDLSSLALGGKQMDLFTELQTLNKPIVTVLIQGRPHDIETVCMNSDAVLTAWYPGQEGGSAIAALLTGEESPSGKLSLSYPRNSGQLPVYYYQRDIAMKEDYYDLKGSPLLPFGFGQTYTRFEYQKITVNNSNLTKNDLENGQHLHLTVSIKNTGSYDAKETILLFVKLAGGSVIQRKKILRGFEKYYFKKGEAQDIDFYLSYEDLCYYDADQRFKLAESFTILMDCLQEPFSFHSSTN
ncbi:glycoside hydrolase family 3 N-terminal domain-containing protein [Carnobacterium gallinarum]|uniref:glycoside hydrolase family 3 N-terminal domain-containing protein n=1 Tax=Carnobacterium gallinarum TaxID=2749 RepID=UPI000553E295|nr:glycoside hydrolase family 3 N-terminal domain-containing protein [Carnobacterium gallinarum]